VIIYPLIDRVTYETRFEMFVVNEYVDHVIIGSLFVFWLIVSMSKSRASYVGIGIVAALFVAAAAAGNDQALDGISVAALPALVALILCDRYFLGDRKKILANQCELMPNYLAIIGIVLGVIALILALSPVIFSSPSPEGTSLIRNYGHEVFLLLSRLSPILLVILVSSYPVKLFINFVSTLRRKGRTDNQSSNSFAIAHETAESGRKRVVFLSLFVLLSIVIASIPHLPSINKDGGTVGVDTPQYGIWMNELGQAQDSQDFLRKAFIEQQRGDRPISLLLIYGFQQAVASLNDNLDLRIELLPFILGPSLVLVVYFMTRELTRNDTVSLLAAFLTAISYHVLIGIYSGFYANWIALIFGYLSIAFLFKFLRSHSKRNLIMYGALSTLMLFSHVYTWSIFTIATGIFLIAMMKFSKQVFIDKHISPEDIEEKRKRKHSAVLLLFVLGSIVAIDIGRTFLTGSSSGIEGDLKLGEQLAGPEQFALRWNNLTYTTMVYVGGLLANFLILVLGIYWLVRSKLWNMQDIFIIIFLSIGILPFLFGEWIIQTRVFYNIPFQIPAAIGLMYVRQQSAGLLRSIPIYIWLIAFSILAVSNFYLVLPS
jgi:hypothetical protein